MLRLYAALAKIQDVLRHHPRAVLPESIDYYPPTLTLEECARIGSLQGRFDAAMDDDFNTAQALGYLFETVRLGNRLLEAPGSDPGYLAILHFIRRNLVELGGALNLLQADPQEMIRTLRQKSTDLQISPEEIAKLIAARTQARKDKDFAKADAVRKELSDKGILLEDTPQGTVWKVKG